MIFVISVKGCSPCENARFSSRFLIQGLCGSYQQVQPPVEVYLFTLDPRSNEPKDKLFPIQRGRYYLCGVLSDSNT